VWVWLPEKSLISFKSVDRTVGIRYTVAINKVTNFPATSAKYFGLLFSKTKKKMAVSA